MDKGKPVSVFDVAAYILGKQPKKQPITAWKLQKLVYYCQAWSLVWDEQPLFKEKILAWANGPVVKQLYAEHQGLFHVKECAQGNPHNLSKKQKANIDEVLGFYGDKTGQFLSDLTHMEQPWILARTGLQPGEPGETEISLASMLEFYAGVQSSYQAKVNNLFSRD